MKQPQIKNLQIGHVANSNLSFKIERHIAFNSATRESVHRHDFYAIFLMHEGCGEHIIDFENYKIVANRLFYVRPGQMHFFDASDDVRYSSFMFSEDFLLESHLSDTSSWNSIATIKDLNDEENILIEKWLDMINSEISRNEKMNSHILQLEVYTLMQELVRLSEGEKSSDAIPATVLKYRKLVNEHFAQWQQVQDYATELGVTPNYLNILVKKHLGTSALQLIHSRILLEVKRLLFSTDLDVSEIAYRVGFNEMSYFTRFFKRLTGMTPSVFKTKMNKMYHL